VCRIIHSPAVVCVCVCVCVGEQGERASIELSSGGERHYDVYTHNTTTQTTAHAGNTTAGDAQDTLTEGQHNTHTHGTEKQYHCNPVQSDVSPDDE